MLGGVGFEFGTVKTDMAQGCHTGFHRQKYALLKTFLEIVVMVFSEITQYPEVGTV